MSKPGHKAALYTLVCSAVCLLASGCICLGFRDEYAALGASQTKDFSSKIYIDKQSQRTYLPFFRIDVDQTPHDLVFGLWDEEAGWGHVNFTEFVLDSLELQFYEQPAVVLIGESTPLAERTFVIPKSTEDVLHVQTPRRVFKGVITRREAFVLTMKGQTVRATGERVPFTRTEVYRYEGRQWTCWTLLQELSGV